MACVECISLPFDPDRKWTFLTMLHASSSAAVDIVRTVLCVITSFELARLVGGGACYVTT